MGFTAGEGMTQTTVRENPFVLVGNSVMYSGKVGGMVLRSLGELLTGKLGMDAMGGPITTIKVTSEVASSGFASLLNIASFIGVNLAVFNLLPIPALDGGRSLGLLLTTAIEKITRKKIDPKYEGYIHGIGMILLLALMAIIMFKDIFVIFKG